MEKVQNMVIEPDKWLGVRGNQDVYKSQEAVANVRNFSYFR